MLEQMPKVLLLVALLATCIVSSVPAFAGRGGCGFDATTLQCIDLGCRRDGRGCLQQSAGQCVCFEWGKGPGHGPASPQR